MRGGLTMAERNGDERKGRKKGPGIFTRAGAPVADFSYHPNDSLAQMIVDAWVDENFKTLLLNPQNAKSLLASRGVYLDKPVVIEEDDYKRGHTKKFDDEVVFVLPNQSRAGSPPPGQSLLETARLLMACVPHGI
jgi:hypothetical protein